MTAAHMAEEISDLLRERLGVRGRDLQTLLRRARRKLPRHVRRAIAQIGEAAQLEAHPKLARRIDRAALEAAWQRARAHLQAQNRRSNRADILIGALASGAFALLASAALLVAALRWRGFL